MTEGVKKNAPFYKRGAKKKAAAKAKTQQQAAAAPTATGDAKKAAPKGGKKTAPRAGGGKTPTDTEKYVVIVRNVEANLAHIHSEELPRHLRLNPNCNLSTVQQGSTCSSGQLQPWYKVAVREETRSAMVHLGYDENTASTLFNAAATSEGKAKREKIQSASNLVTATPTAFYGSTLSLGARKKGELTDESEAQHQKEHCTVEAGTTLDISDRQLSKILRDVPGFLGSWKLTSKRYRVVFQNTRTLFAAKSLLDAFEADGIRVTITLPDNLQSGFTEYTETSAE